MTADTEWSERRIAAALARQTFQKRSLVIVPNCTWTGHECDLLVITADLRVIDVEVKISRADLRADAAKDKWFHGWNWRVDGPDRSGHDQRRRRQWPRRVWKHYYAMPRPIWDASLFDCLPSTTSGVLLMSLRAGAVYVTCERRATPCRDADRLDAADAVDIARLASLRMWDAYDAVDRLRAETVARRGQTEVAA